MKVGGHRKTETEVERCYEKRHEGERSKDRSTRPENVEIENWMRRPQIGKRPKKKNHTLHKRRLRVYITCWDTIEFSTSIRDIIEHACGGYRSCLL